MTAALSEEELTRFRKRLVVAATERYRAHGLDSVTMRALAGDLGCSRTTPYRYFADRDAIIDDMRVAAATTLNERLDESLSGLTDPLARLEAAGDTYLAFAAEEPESYRLMFELASPEAPSSELADQMDVHRRRMTDLVADVIDSGFLRGDPERIAHLFWAAMHGAITLDLAHRLDDANPVEQLAPDLIETVFAGLRERGEPNPTGDDHD